jgi:hypothetical protein
MQKQNLSWYGKGGQGAVVLQKRAASVVLDFGFDLLVNFVCFILHLTYLSLEHNPLKLHKKW